MNELVVASILLYNFFFSSSSISLNSSPSSRGLFFQPHRPDEDADHHHCIMESISLDTDLSQLAELAAIWALKLTICWEENRCSCIDVDENLWLYLTPHKAHPSASLIGESGCWSMLLENANLAFFSLARAFWNQTWTTLFSRPISRPRISHSAIEGVL